MNAMKIIKISKIDGQIILDPDGNHYPIECHDQWLSGENKGKMI